MSWALRNTLYVSGMIIIPYIYIVWRLIISTKIIWPDHYRSLRYFLIGVTVLVNMLPLVMLYYYSRGTLLEAFVYRTQTNFLDYAFLFPFWIGLIIVVEILPYFLASDILEGIGRLFFSGLRETIRKWSAIIKLSLAVFFSCYIIITIFLDTYHVSESRYSVTIKNLPIAMDNLQLALLADLQVDRFTQDTKINGVKTIINENEPDLLFFAGDLVTRGTDFIDQGVDVMCGLQAGMERIACLGDHDFWADAGKISSGLQNCNWTFLDNNHRIINYKNKKILVTGVTYIYSRRISREKLVTLLKNAPAADLKILLVHQPAKIVIDAAEKFGYDILLAGHTHGGQVVFRPFGFTLTPTKFENKYYSGHYKKNDMHIFVTNGVGLTLMPLRYHAQAEVMTISVKR